MVTTLVTVTLVTVTLVTVTLVTVTLVTVTLVTVTLIAKANNVTMSTVATWITKKALTPKDIKRVNSPEMLCTADIA